MGPPVAKGGCTDWPHGGQSTATARCCRSCS